jgi:hypothetical protein
MYRAVLTDGDVECVRYDEGEHGVDLFDEDDEHVAFVPYTNLIALLNEELEDVDTRSIA